MKGLPTRPELNVELTRFPTDLYQNHRKNRAFLYEMHDFEWLCTPTLIQGTIALAGASSGCSGCANLHDSQNHHFIFCELHEFGRTLFLFNF